MSTLSEGRTKPILFSGPMVRALLEGRKTQTRRILKTQPHAGLRDSVFVASGVEDGHGREIKIPYYPGDLLWVRETWQQWPPQNRMLMEDRPRIYRATDEEPRGPFPEWSNWSDGKFRWRPGIHMNRWASRLTLEVTDVRIQRLHEISEADARAEGCPVTWDGKPYDPPTPEQDSWQGYGRYSFCLLWSEINGKDSWAANPWVAAISFIVHKCNVDAMPKRALEPAE